MNVAFWRHHTCKLHDLRELGQGYLWATVISGSTKVTCSQGRIFIMLIPCVKELRYVAVSSCDDYISLVHCKQSLSSDLTTIIVIELVSKDNLAKLKNCSSKLSNTNVPTHFTPSFIFAYGKFN